jgi:tRNA dimethylallyltransferase
MSTHQNKIIAIVGTNASGKTGLGVHLANKFNGEIVSADSRQVYKGMDIGTGKDLSEYKVKNKDSEYRIDNTKFSGSSRRRFAPPQDDSVFIPYHLIDIVEPDEEFSLAQFQKLAYQAIDDIIKRGKLPIIVGGTGLYVQAIIDEYDLSDAGPDKKLRQELEKLNADKLFKKLHKLNTYFADRLNESDRKNKRRLIRYIEIIKDNPEKEAEPLMRGSASDSNKPHPSLLLGKGRGNKGKYESLIIGLTWPRETLAKRIRQRLLERLKKRDMVGEVKRLHEQGISWRRLEDFGLEYKFIAQYLQKKIEYGEMVEKLYRAIKQFAKRQMTWLKRWERPFDRTQGRQGAKIYWVKEEKEAEELVKKFIK